VKTKVLTIDAQQPDPAMIEEAAAALREGKLVAFPTETVYGLGANALNEAAVQKIFDAKERPSTDPLIVHIAHVGQVGQLAASFPAAARKLALSFWAGPLTLILPKKLSIPDLVTAGLPNVALRAPAHRARARRNRRHPDRSAQRQSVLATQPDDRGAREGRSRWSRRSDSRRRAHRHRR
jgi:L-threonylcarbamoyladenylate synthase